MSQWGKKVRGLIQWSPALSPAFASLFLHVPQTCHLPRPLPPTSYWQLILCSVCLGTFRRGGPRGNSNSPHCSGSLRPVTRPWLKGAVTGTVTPLPTTRLPSPPSPAKFKEVGPLAAFLLCGLGLIAHLFGSPWPPPLSADGTAHWRESVAALSYGAAWMGSAGRGLLRPSLHPGVPRHHQPQDLRGGRGGPGGSNSCPFPEGPPS